MEKLKSLYVDTPSWVPAILPDDFIVAVGKTKSNSVYHVVESKVKANPEKRMVRYYLKVLKTDLILALRRDIDQQLIPMQWYSREKKPTKDLKNG